MVTMLKNSNWNDKPQVKKGDIGESIVRSKLEQKGYVIYKAITDSAHAFDFLAIKDKIKFLIAEVKSKARMNKYNATGINIKHFEEYKRIYEKYKIDIVLFFVDEHPSEKRIYCGDLKILMQEKTIDKIQYPNTKIAKNIILFSLTDMKHIAKLEDNEVEELVKYNTRSYEYSDNIVNK